MIGQPSAAVELRALPGARILAGAPDWRTAWQAVPAGEWDDECRRFHAGLFEVDRALLNDAEPTLPLERVFQGPISDAFAHLGQLALLRRLASRRQVHRRP